MVRQFLTFLIALYMFLPATGYADSIEETYFPASDSLLRVREVKGDVWFNAGTDSGWKDVYENMPLTEGYGLLTGESGFIDVEVDSETFIRLASSTEIFLKKIHQDRVLIRYIGGSVYVSHISREGFRTIIFDLGIQGSLEFQGQGAIRIDEEPIGKASVAVREGNATVFMYGKEFFIGEGEMALFGEGIERSSAYGKDSWDALNEKRDNEVLAISGRGYIEEAIPGRYDVEKYGEWIVVPAYGYVWRPYVMVSGWSPFLYGKWVFLAPFGWTWVSLEPWGWITYHYGNWVPTFNHGWVWVPARGYKVWYPARARIIVEKRSVRWVPLRPGERVSGLRAFRIDNKYGRKINGRSIFSRPVLIKKRKVFEVREYSPLPRRKEGRRGIYRKRIERNRVLIKERSRTSIDRHRKGDLRKGMRDDRRLRQKRSIPKAKSRLELEASRAYEKKRGRVGKKASNRPGLYQESENGDIKKGSIRYVKARHPDSAAYNEKKRSVGKISRRGRKVRSKNHYGKRKRR